VSYAIKGEFPSVEAHLRRLDVMQVCISAVTRAELRFGVRRLRGATRLAAEVERFLSGVHTLPWDENAADQFAEVRADLERNGARIASRTTDTGALCASIGIMDTMIAAHAKAVRAILVTNNVRHFHKVKGLGVENWTD
jgi:tRNA(fMet)-specific endonuclease VapC